MPQPQQPDPIDNIQFNAAEKNKIESQSFEADFIDRYQKSVDDDAAEFGDAYFEDTAPAAAAAKPQSVVEKVDGFYKGREANGPVADAGLSMGRDVSLGVIQAPREIARGVTKGVNGMLDFLHDISDWTPDSWKSEAELKNDKALQLPVPDEPPVPTVTGSLIEGVSQFMVGLKGIDKAAKGYKALRATGEVAEGVAKGGKIINAGKEIAGSAAKGAGADVISFDEHEARLSNIIQQVPELQNPVTEFLQAEEDDGALEGKLKQAAEGVLGNVVGDGLVKGIGLLKKGMSAKKGLEAEGKTIADALAARPEDGIGGVVAKDFEFLGDPAGERVLPKTKLEIADEEVKGAFGKTKQVPAKPSASIDDFEINFARIDGPEDIKQLMDDMVNKPELKISIEAERRGERSNAQTLTAAQDIDGFESMMARRTGDAFNAEQIVAARKVYYDTTSKLMEAAKRASGPQASDIDVFNFRKLIATHHAVQKEFMGIRAEAGRALQAWRIPVGEGPENSRLLSQTLQEFGGSDASKELAQRISSLGENLNTDQINAIVNGSAIGRTADALSEAWTLGLLTNPTTHVVNLSSNVLTSLQLGVERLAEARFEGSPVTIREGVAFFQGIIESQKLGFKNAVETFKTGESNFSGNKIELSRDRKTSREILDPDGKAGFLSKGIDWWGGLLSKYVGGALTSSDEYSKTILYQAQLRALATREGISRGLDPLQLRQHIADSLASPSSSMRADATTFAAYGTFTKDLGKSGKWVQNIIGENPALRFVAPFIRTPMNIFKFGFERTPLALVTSKVRADLNAGGARRAAALAKVGIGTSVMAISTDFALNGLITGAGPADPDARAALKRTGWQPYSVKLDDKYYSYSRFEPLATLLGGAADIAEILSNYDAYDLPAQDETDNLVYATIMAMGNQVVGKTFMQGFADLAQALSDPKRYGEHWANKLVGSVVPAGAAALTRVVDPEVKQVMNMADAIKSRLPGFSKDVPPRRNIWGEAIQYYTPTGNMAEQSAQQVLSLFNPVYYSADKDSAVDEWMLSNGFRISMPDKTTKFDGVSIDLRDKPKAYDRLVVLRGSEVKLMQYGNQTMKDFFSNLANEKDPYGRHMSFFLKIGNDYDRQQSFIQKVVSDYQSAAKDRLVEEYPDIGAEIVRGKANAEKFNSARESWKAKKMENAQ